jgi:hypothetical protein
MVAQLVRIKLSMIKVIFFICDAYDFRNERILKRDEKTYQVFS